jgi:hypothetical protein
MIRISREWSRRAIKLHCLADPMHGIETGTLAGDLLALRQVAQFLGQVAA